MTTKKLLKLLTLATGLTVGGSALAAGGDIYEIRPCLQDGTATASYASIDSPMSSGETVYFNMRLIQRVKADSSTSWYLKWVGFGSELVDDALYPLQVGIYVSGELRYATLVDCKTDASRVFTDLIFSYTTQPGDFALPIVLATEAGPANEADESSPYVLNRTDKWQLANDAGNDCHFWFWTNMWPQSGPDGSAVQDYSLSKCGFYVQTIDFDDDWHVPADMPGKTWRAVHQNSTIALPSQPKLEALAAPSNAIVLHVWSMDESVVKVKGGRTVDLVLPSGETVPTQVGDVRFVGGQMTSNFQLEGVTMSNSCNIVLSPWDRYNYNSATGAKVIDYLTVPVMCIEPMPPTVVVESDTRIVYSDKDYRLAKATLTVYLSQAYSNAVTVAVTPSAQNGEAIDWADYVRFSTTQSEVAVLPDGGVGNEPKVVIPANSTAKQQINVFFLRADVNTAGGGNQLVFKPSIVNDPVAIADFGENLTPAGIEVYKSAPVITTPAEGSKIYSIADEDKELVVAVEDDYADISYFDPTGANGYLIWVKYRETDAFTQLPGVYYVGEGGTLCLVKDDGTGTGAFMKSLDKPVIHFPSDAYSTEESPYVSAVRVRAPVSGKDSEDRNFNSIITKKRSSVLTTPGDVFEYHEGDKVPFKATLSQAYESDIYAFLLAGGNAAAGMFKSGSCVVCADTDPTTTQGQPINAGQLETAQFLIQVLDGLNEDDGGLNLSFQVAFCTTPQWSEATRIAGYKSNYVNIFVYNVEPLIKRVEWNGFDSEGDGYVFPSKVPKGMEQHFKAVVTDKGTYDKTIDTPENQRFQTKWTVYLNGAAKYNETVVGNPDDVTFDYSFPAAGDWTIRCQVKDKDMDDWSEVDYTVGLQVLDNPVVEVICPETVVENDTKQKIQIQASYWDTDFTGTLQVKVTVREYSPGKANPGYMKLDGTYASAEENVYYVTLKDANPVDLAIEEMDGTDTSSLYGFVVKAEIVATDPATILPTSHEDASTYYIPGEKRVLIDNIAPVCIVNPGENTNRWEVAGGAATSHPIRWQVKSDVKADFAGIPGYEGVKVSFTGCDNATEFFITEPTTQTFVPNFGSSQGDIDVTLTIEDKDGGYQTWTWQFTVTPSKMLDTVADGPSGGITSSKLSQKYALITEGIGQGHVYVDNAVFSSADNFTLTWNCGKDTEKKIYAWGYKVDNPDDTGTLDGGRDIRIDTRGHANGNDRVDTPYHYPYADMGDDDKKDSFFYCWLLHARGEDSRSITSSYLDESLSPERPAGLNGVAVNGYGLVLLPTEQTEDKNYIKTTVEAIFSREWLPADNLGDINQDGVPDYFAIRGWGNGNLITLKTGAENVTDDDLTDLSAENPDGDYMPGVYVNDDLIALSDDGRNSYAPIGVPFNTIYEIRGLDFGLNAIDATTSLPSFGEVEQTAWEAYAEANGLDAAAPDLGVWSPEPRGKKARMDPTMEDTDADHFPDGWEYFFWYQAHVWYPAGHKMGQPRPNCGQLYTFEKFDLDNPIHGTPIAPEDVEARFNPCEPYVFNVRTESPDFDGDGLSDLEELALGTNPCHWDTDGDHLCDGWEVMMCLDPLGISRAGNGDKDWMAARNLINDYIWVTDGAETPSTIDDPYSLDAVLYDIITPLRIGNDINLQLVTVRDLTVEAFRFVPKEDILNPGQILTYGEVLPNEVPPPDAMWGSPMVDRVLRIEKFFIPEGTKLSIGIDYALIHNQVREAYDYDPRTGWSGVSNGYVAPRWNPMINTELSPFDVAGYGVNTSQYYNYDEYLLMMYRFQYGIRLPDERPARMDAVWDWIQAKTTNPTAAYPEIAEGAADTNATDVAAAGTAGAETNRTAEAAIADYLAQAFAQAGSKHKPVVTHGADTDGDGVPDGWELYTFRCPNDPFDSYGEETSMISQVPSDYDGDVLIYSEEFAGTDSCNVYQECASIYKNHPGNNSGWFNKFFPTNPGTWVGFPGNPDGADTDDDGIADNLEGIGWIADFYCAGMVYQNVRFNFIYGEPQDSITCCIRGGGMNPCTFDTDVDGLPDGWEMAHAGVAVSTVDLGNSAGVDLPDSVWMADGIGLGNMQEGYYIAAGMDATWGGDACSGGMEDELLGTVRDVDFDHDGLQNYQEYLVQAIRHFRYDDISTPLMGRLLTEGEYDLETSDLLSPHTQEYRGYAVMDVGDADDFVANVVQAWGDAGAAAIEQCTTRPDGVNSHPWTLEGWRSLGYFAPPVHSWDRALTCMLFMNPRYMLPVTGSLIVPNACAGYVSTDPRMADTDGDGMDDYYEMFHGLNPILGTIAAAPDRSSWIGGKSGDIISATYWMTIYPLGNSTPTYNGFYNEWTHPDYNVLKGRGGAQPTGTDPASGQNTVGGVSRLAPVDAPEAFDPVLYPWIMGSPMVDADGDGLRNDEERILANVADPVTRHTDPTPQWFTERTSPMSYVAQYYVAGETVNQQPYPAVMGGPEFSDVALVGSTADYMFGFEENEGYDTDNDLVPDGREIIRTVSTATDPLRYDDPARRQALWLDGVNGYVMSKDQQYRGTEAVDLFKQFTVECWVCPEKTGVAQTIIERSTAYDGNAINKDKVAIRANFRIGLAPDGRVYGMFDNADAIESGMNAPVSCQRVDGQVLPLNRWSHVALVYDGAKLSIYVNGLLNDSAMTTLIPANGITLITQSPDMQGGDTLVAPFPSSGYQTTPSAFFIGARPKKENVYALYPYYVDPATGRHMESFANLQEFFQGYVDEVRVWDGARTGVEIAANYDKAMSFDDVAANRDEVFKAWELEATRNNNDGKENLPAELCLHYNFTTLPGAVDAGKVAKAPIGFTDKVIAAAQSSYDQADNPDIDPSGLYANILELKGGTAGELAWTDRYGNARCLEIGWWKECLVHSTVYSDYNVVPWIENTVAHLPVLDGSAIDAPYYGTEISAGYTPAAAAGVNEFVFPNGANPYTHRVYNLDRFGHLFTLGRLIEMGGMGYGEQLLKYQFHLRSEFVGTSDLIPLGGAYAKTSTNLWDGASADAWEYTGDDTDANGIPDWWEAYARENYCAGVLASDEDLDWDTVVLYHGIERPAWQAYLIDLYRGMQPNGKIDKAYAATYDSDLDGIPDWWEKLFGVYEYGADDDTDGDGLCNYAEYLLSEVFDLGVIFDPANPYSISLFDLDYFFRIGDLYAGEIFTDHDHIEDPTEDTWSIDYSNRYQWDALSDNDEDGWSTWSEVRYRDFTSRILAQNISHVVGDAEMKDMPVPTLKLTLRYNGQQPLKSSAGAAAGQGGAGGQPDENTLAPIVVQTFTDKDLVVPDATFTLQPGVSTEYNAYLGAWAERTVRGTLTPGYVNPGSVELEFAEVARNETYTWQLNDLTPLGEELALMYPAGYYFGSYETYMGYLGAFGPDYVVLQSHDFAWASFSQPYAFTVTQDETGEHGYLCIYGERIGTINLLTGEYSMDMTELQNVASQATNDEAVVSLAQTVLRLRYDSVVPKLQSNKLDLFLGTPNQGYVKEGKNTILAFYDLDGSGTFSPGEPLATVNDVDVGWYQAKAELELTDTSPIITRADLSQISSGSDSALGAIAGADAGAGGGNSDRHVLYGTEDGDVIDLIVGELSGGKYQRFRVVRTLINGVGIQNIGVENRVVVDKWVELEQRPYFFEGDVLANGEFDLDWSTFTKDVMQNPNVAGAGIDPMDVTYRIVLGNGTIDVFATNNLYSIATVRHFDAAGGRPRPVALSPGRTDAVVYGARPTFRWKLERDGVKFNSYPAFRLQITQGGKTVWDSGLRRTPATDRNGVYSFTPDVYAGDVLTGDGAYDWRVSMYNAKFQTDAYSTNSCPFRMNTQDGSYGYGSIKVCAKYFGPADVLAAGTVRVEAYDTPDFSGDPVARTFVADADLATVSAVNAERTFNAKLIGLPEGTYYIRAFIDSTRYGKSYAMDEWESAGYLCPRETVPEIMFSPLPVTVGSVEAAKRTYTVYIEDADTNGNCIPDAYEMVKNRGSLDKGAENVDALVAGVAINKALADNLQNKLNPDHVVSSYNAYLRSTLGNTVVAALTMGVDPARVSFGANGLEVEGEIVADTLRITGLKVAAAAQTVEIDVDADVEAGNGVVSPIYAVVNKGATAKVRIYHTENLASDWTPVATAEVAFTGVEAKVTVPFEAELPQGGFFRAVIEE